jgi:SAM-dependent methyltransferase
MTWYKDWFQDANYRVVYEHRDDREAEQMIDLIERTIGHHPERKVLDLGCGSGRHSISLTKRGYKNVIGIDLSPTLLKEAREHSAAQGFEIEFLERDMRNIPDGPYDLVVNLFTSFGYFESDEENSEVIQNVAQRLLPNGYFVIDFFNSEWVREHHVSHDERKLPGGARLEQTRWIENGRIEKRLLIRDSTEAREYIESVRLFELDDFKRMFKAAGLTLEKCFGDYEGGEFSVAHSPRLIMFAKR